MRRWIAGAVAVSALAVAGPAFAQAKPADPVAALKKQFVAGQGVKLTEHTSITVGRESYTRADRQGLIGFDDQGHRGRRGHPHSDRHPEGAGAAGQDGREGRLHRRLRRSAHRADLLGQRRQRLYVNGGLYGMLMPENKSWIGMNGSPSSAAYGDQLINVFEARRRTRPT